MGLEMPGAQISKDIHSQNVFRGEDRRLTPEMAEKAGVVEGEVWQYAAARRAGEIIEKLSSEEMRFLRAEIGRQTVLLEEKEAALAAERNPERQLAIEKEIWIIEDGIRHIKKKIEGQSDSKNPSIYRGAVNPLEEEAGKKTG